MHPDDAAIERFLSFNSGQYFYVERLELYTDFGEDDEFSLNTLVLKIELLSNAYKSNLCITFRGVRNLQLNLDRSDFQLAGGLRITSFRESQWEGVRYQVSEKDGKHLSFLCWDFEASLMQETGRVE